MKASAPREDGLPHTRGDGDLSAIGTAESIHAAARGENVVAIYINNNAIYGMTGGQMAPTTLLGMKTATTPHGRDPRLNGYPTKIAEMMAHLDGTTYITRQSVHTPANVRKTKKAIRKAFENALAGNGFAGRGSRYLQQRLEAVARSVEPVARAEHAALLSAGRYQGRKKRRLRI